MWKKLKRPVGCVIFLAVGAWIMIHAAFVLRPVGTGTYREVLPGFYSEEKDSLDVVCIGSSAVHRYINPNVLWRETGVTSYCLVSGSMPAVFPRFLMDEAEKTQSPDLYIVEVREFIKEHKRARPGIKTYRVMNNMDFSLNKLKLSAYIARRPAQIVTGFMDLLTNHSNWENLTAENLSYFRNRKEQDMKGWYTITRRKKQKKPETVPQIDASLGEYEREEMALLLDECAKKNRKVLFVAMPYVYDETFQAKNEELRGMVTEAGFDYLDLTKDNVCGLNYNRDFYDHGHVNVRGSEKVSKVLSDYLSEHYEFSRGYSEEVVRSYEESCSAYQKELDEYLQGRTG